MFRGWLGLNDYLLFVLEQRTRIEFNTTPLRILVGELILWFVPSLIAMALLNATGFSSISVGVVVLGFIVALVTTLQFVKGVDWFDKK